MDQLNLFDECKKFKIKELILKNFKRIHGEYSFILSPGINIITPDYLEQGYEVTEVNVGIDFDPLDPHVDTLCQNDIVDMIRLLKNERSFKLWDYSFFADSKYIAAGVLIEKELGIEKYYERRKRYRGIEQIGEVVNFNKREKSQLKKFDDKQGALENFEDLIKGLSIYPNDYPLLDRVIYTNNFDDTIEKYPKLDIEDYVESINSISDKYNLGYAIVNLNDRYIVNGIDYNEKLLELSILIAIEKQLKNSVVLIRHGSIFSGLYDENIDIGMDMLSEFVDQGQQVILLYSNPYNVWDWQRVVENTEMLNRQQNIPNLYKIVWFNEKHMDENEWQKNVTIKLAARELIERQEFTLEEKENLSMNIIRKALSKAEVPALGCSYGKDSMVLLHLIKRTIDHLRYEYDLLSEEQKKCYIEPKYPILCFCDTGVEFPEHYEFIEKVEENLVEMGFKINHTKPKTSFFKIIKKGFPMFGKSVRKESHPVIYQKIKELGIKTCGNQCCQKLKEEPSAELYKELNVDMVFMGLLAVESQRRRENWYKTGDIYFNKTEGYNKALPIIHFKEEDIFSYIEKYNLPMSPIYSMGYWKTDKSGEERFIKYKRTGCWPCSMSIQFEGNNMELLRHTHPKLWELIMIKKGLAKEIYKFKHGIQESNWSDVDKNILERYLEVKPCHFDTTDWKIS